MYTNTNGSGVVVVVVVVSLLYQNVKTKVLEMSRSPVLSLTESIVTQRKVRGIFIPGHLHHPATLLPSQKASESPEKLPHSVQ